MKREKKKVRRRENGSKNMFLPYFSLLMFSRYCGAYVSTGVLEGK